MFNLVDSENNPELGSIFMHAEKNREVSSVEGNVEPRIRHQKYAVLCIRND